jgi:hypothetical protein
LFVYLFRCFTQFYCFVSHILSPQVWLVALGA